MLKVQISVSQVWILASMTKAAWLELMRLKAMHEIL